MNKAKSGDTIIFDKPIEFLNGKVLQELRFIQRSHFYDPITGQGYHIVSWRGLAHTIKREGQQE